MRSTRKPWTGLALVAVLAVDFGAATAEATTAPERTDIKEATLPSGRTMAAATWADTHVLMFGGWSGTPSDEILAYNPGLDHVVTKQSKLPLARSAASAVWNGDYAFIFGGWNGVPSNQILKYDPSQDKTTLLTTLLPTGRSETSAVWAGSAAYIIGGYDGLRLDQIVRFDPANGSIRVMDGKLPTARDGTSAVWTGSVIYIFGGTVNGTEILKYDPASDRVTSMGASLPTARYHAAAFWDGRYAYIVGGDGAGPRDQIVRFDPQADAAVALSATLPSGRGGVSAVWGDGYAYLLGGCCTASGAFFDDVIRFEPSNVYPEPTFTWVISGRRVAVDAAGSRDPDGQLSTYRWRWGDGAETTTGPQTLHEYAAYGNYTLRLTVTDNRGLGATANLALRLREPSVQQGSGGTTGTGTVTGGEDDGGGTTGTGSGTDGSTGSGDEGQGQDVRIQPPNEEQGSGGNAGDSGQPNQVVSSSTAPFQNQTQILWSVRTPTAPPFPGRGNATAKEDGGDTPGFTGVLLVVALALAAVVAHRRRHGPT